MKLGTWLFSLISPAIGRILTALGLSVVSIAGMDVIFQQLQGKITASFGALPGDMLNVFLLAGGGQALGIVMGAVATRLMLWQVQNSVKILGVNPS